LEIGYWKLVHVPVLLHEAITLLDPKPNECFVDATLGAGGYAKEILARTAPQGKLFAVDLDENAVAHFERYITATEWAPRVIVQQGNFADLPELMGQNHFPRADGLIADLGFSSDQIEASGRGFTFLKDEPLLMAYDIHSSCTAAAIVNGYTEKELGELIQRYSNERYAARIAKNIVVRRKARKIITTKELVDIIIRSVPERYERGRIHPATRTFLALRIAVNNELENLTRLLARLEAIVKPGGRVAIISFQSLEDKLVKDAFRQKQKEGRFVAMTKKPLIPGEEEIRNNSRARSAKLRVARI